MIELCKVLLLVLVLNGQGHGVPNARVTIASGDSFAEDITDLRGIAMVSVCQTKESYLRVQFGQVFTTTTVGLMKADAVVRVTLKVNEIYFPLIEKTDGS